MSVLKAIANGGNTGGGGGTGGVALYDGTNSITSGTAQFSNSNGVSFGFNGQTITGSVVAQSAQTIGAYMSGNTAGASSTTIDARSLSFYGSGNITVGVSQGSILIAQTGAGGQSNQTLGLYATGNTTQNSSTTLDARTLSFNFLGAATGGFSNGSIDISSPVQTNQSVGLYALGNTTQNSSTTLDARTLSINGLGGATVGYSNGSIQISAPVAQTNQSVGFYAVGNTTQNSSTTLDARTVSFNGLGGVTVGFSNGSVDISGAQTVAQTNQTIGIYAVSNTTLSTSGTVDARTLSFEGAGAVSVGVSNGSVQISAPNTIAQTNQSIGFYAVGNTTQNSSTTLDARTLSINGLGIVTAGFSNGSIDISATQSNQNVTAANGGFAFQTLSFSNVNGVSFGTSAGSAITGSVAAQTNQSVGFYAVGNTTQNSSTTLDARTLSINALGAITAGFSNGSIDLSVPVQTNQSLGIYASSNTTGASSSSTYDARSLTLQFLGAVSGGWSNGSLQISAGQGGQTNQTLGLYAVSNTTLNSSTTLDARTLSFEGAGGVTVGYSNGSIVISGNTGGGAGGGVSLGLVYAIAAGNLIM